MFLFAFLLPLIDFTPAVFALPLSFVTTPVFDETVLLLAFAGILAFVSTTPVRGGLPTLLLLVFAPVLALSVVPQPARAAVPINTNASAKLRRIVVCPPSFCRLS